MVVMRMSRCEASLSLRPFITWMPPKSSMRLKAPEALEACESGTSCESGTLGWAGTCTRIASIIASMQVAGKALPAKSWYCGSLALASDFGKSSTGKP